MYRDEDGVDESVETIPGVSGTRGGGERGNRSTSGQGRMKWEGTTKT